MRKLNSFKRQQVRLERGLWNNRKEPEVIIERVKKKDIKDGSIVLMHPTYATTQCLDDIIQIIRDKVLKPGMLSNIF